MHRTRAVANRRTQFDVYYIYLALWHTYGAFAAAMFSALITDYLYFSVFIIASAVICYTDTFRNDHINYIEIGDSVSIKTPLG